MKYTEKEEKKIFHKLDKLLEPLFADEDELQIEGVEAMVIESGEDMLYLYDIVKNTPPNELTKDDIIETAAALYEIRNGAYTAQDAGFPDGIPYPDIKILDDD